VNSIVLNKASQIILSHTHTNAHTLFHTHSSTHTLPHTHTHTHTHIYIYIYIYVYIQHVRAWGLWDGKATEHQQTHPAVSHARVGGRS
jgi:hypothetical protein